ncbi:hypothetical protein CK203_110688 [Vitis vinifera]|uniref:Uncharacterized protein n=1 Tax=Vitis vinifera TaxID=29760 RepID=A0A438FDV9_VITVI|nr:hypothetical protein CK203_110688 [Vitis vinifera]
MSGCLMWEKGSSRHFNDWEMEEVKGLFRKTASFDRSTALFTKALSDHFPWSIIWRSWALLRLQTQTTRIGGKGNREVERGWTTREVRDSYRLSLWKDISKSWDKFTLKANIRIGFLPTRMQQWQIYGEGEEVEVDVGRFLLEDPSKIGSKRRCLGFWNTSFLQKCKKGRTL